MSQIYDSRITIRLKGSAKDQIIRHAQSDGITMTDLVRQVVSSYLQWKRKQIHGLGI